MSIPVAVDEIAAEAADRPYAYLVTVGDGPRAHVVAVRPSVTDTAIVVSALGRRTLNNLGVQPELTIFWPPVTPDGYTLIVDGSAITEGADACTITPTRGVLHRSAVPDSEPAEGACGSDCVELTEG